jgi:hypothetical protein
MNSNFSSAEILRTRIDSRASTSSVWMNRFQLISVGSFSALLLLSSMYCLLAYIPATYFAFIQSSFFLWMPAFAALQPILFAITFCMVVASFFAGFRNSTQARLGLEILLFGLIAAAYLFASRPLQFIRNDSRSLIVALGFLLMMAFLGALNYAAWLPRLKEYGQNSPAPERLSFSYWRVVGAATFVSLGYPAANYLRFYLTGGRLAISSNELIAWSWAIVTQVLLFLVFFSIIGAGRRIAWAAANREHAQFLVSSTLCWLTLSWIMYQVVLASIPFAGIEAAIYAALFSLAMVLLIGGQILRRRVQGRASAPIPSAIQPRSGTRETVALWLFLVAADLTVPALIGVMDWNSVLEKVWAIAWWAMVAFVVVFRKQVPLRRRAWAPIATVCLSVFVLRAGAHSEARWGNAFSVPQFDAATALEHHSALDASFAAATELLASSNNRDCDALCQFSREQTNIPASALVKLPNIDLVQNLEPTAGKKPNIFIIVVDSLRQDYLSPYNPAVSFTPAIGAFAKDSVVFRNAFTRYGGTTLAEPSIWSGMMQLHKHYVQPYYKVNGLEKLIETDGYKPFVTVDTVLRVLLQPSTDMVKLDTNAEKWTDVDFCSTAQETVQRIDQGQNSGRPIFFFSQPQNVHMITLQRTSKLRPPKRNYAPFIGYYASELQRLDGCFGNFISALKSRGLYENSIIVLTADHGEDLKKMGAERHGYSLRPEVIRVPLIMHVPPAIKEHWFYDPDAIAFNTDITATLYQLLGHGPVVVRPEFGRPLFTKTKAEQQKYARDSYMIASSYGGLYGLLYHNGTGLFIADLEVTGREEFFDLARDPGAKHNILTEKIRQECEAQLRLDIQQIADLYGYRYKPPTLLGWLMR